VTILSCFFSVPDLAVPVPALASEPDSSGSLFLRLPFAALNRLFHERLKSASEIWGTIWKLRVQLLTRKTSSVLPNHRPRPFRQSLQSRAVFSARYLRRDCLATKLPHRSQGRDLTPLRPVAEIADGEPKSRIYLASYSLLALRLSTRQNASYRQEQFQLIDDLRLPVP
jgi:hypothetical protein